MRNTRTAAGFGHMPSKTHAEKVLHVTFGIHKTTIFCPLEQAEPLAKIPWRRSCETLEQQQDSGTCQAKRTPKKCFTSPLESIKQQSFVLSSKQIAEIPWRRSCETLEQQQDSGTCQAKRTPKKCFTSPLESIKQQNNNLLSSRASKTISRNPLEAQLRNTRTAAGFGHMPSKTHAEKVLHVTFGIHKTTIFCPLEQAKPLAEIPWRRSCETLEQQQDSGTCQAKRTPKKCFTSPLESIKQQSFVLSSKQNHYLGGAVAKHSNSSRINGHMPSKTHAEKVLHVTFGIHKTTIFCPLEQAEPLAEIPWRRSCETLEQQQDSGKNNNLLSSRASTTISRNPLEAQLRNTRTAAGFGHMPSKTHAEKVLHVTFGIHKTTIFCPLEQAEPLAEIPWRRSCETLEQQQDSGTCQAKRTPKKCFTSPLEPIKKQSFVLSSKQNH